MADGISEPHESGAVGRAIEAAMMDLKNASRYSPLADSPTGPLPANDSIVRIGGRDYPSDAVLHLVGTAVFGVPCSCGLCNEAFPDGQRRAVRDPANKSWDVHIGGQLVSADERMIEAARNLPGYSPNPPMVLRVNADLVPSVVSGGAITGRTFHDLVYQSPYTSLAGMHRMAREARDRKPEKLALPPGVRKITLED